MSDAKTLSLSLDAELAAQVDEAVASGAYASASEVVEEALLCWRERRVRIPRHPTAHSSDIRPAVPRTSDRSAVSV